MLPNKERPNLHNTGSCFPTDFAVITAPVATPKTVLCEKARDFEEILAGGTQYQHLCGSPLELKDVLNYKYLKNEVTTIKTPAVKQPKLRAARSQNKQRLYHPECPVNLPETYSIIDLR